MKIMPSTIHQTTLSTACAPPRCAKAWGTRWYRATPRINPATKLIERCVRVCVMRTAEGSQPPNNEAAAMAAA